MKQTGSYEQASYAIQDTPEPVFARYLNTSESTVQKWETGAKRPSGPALKLLSIVQKHGLGMLS
ncbi:hypothetical protein IB238_22435 [Rhizobium sp. ARZ01]|uniref:hypothetical protein n=1 Tax=Rhizobium sp. ARZ01 TaxID=2769313 RepID=UPI00177E4BE5|nr:hypothetical protein [Rhizobium sp. ARZ01]